MSDPDSSEGEDIPETHNYTEPVSARLSPETKGRLDDYGERHTIGIAESVRRLVREGLEEDEPESIRARIASVLVFVFVAGFPAYIAYNGQPVQAAGIILILAVADLLQSFRGGDTFIQM